MIFDGYVHQLPDTDPVETKEWLDSLDAVIDTHGKTRARYLLTSLLDRARESQVSFPATVSTPYVNTIPREAEPWFPGDEFIERRIRAFVRWNAAMMVVKANKAADGIGGHLSTYASSASLYEIGFNHFFRGKDDGTSGDHIYFQGHAAPGIYARAFLEGRLEADDLDHFRREIGRTPPRPVELPAPAADARVLGVPHRQHGARPDHRALPGALQPLPAQPRARATPASRRVWAFLGDGECDEPETLGALTLASRENLDNLIFVVNCNLQRLDGPVRGNGKIIQELEAVFRGAGWNVIKVILGSKWDELLANDKDGVLLNQLNTTVDGEFQRYGTESGAYIREHFFGPDPRLRQMVAHLSDDDLVNLPRGGHDYRKLYAAYKAASDNLGSGAPTAILCKTIKGWTLGPGFEGRNSTHQIKKMNKEQLLELRDRLYLHEEIPESALDENPTPYFRPSEDSIEYQYMMERRQALGGSLPRARRCATSSRSRSPTTPRSPSCASGSGGQAVSTTMGFTRLLRNLSRDKAFGQLRRTDHPRRGPHLRHGLAVPAAEDLRRPGPEVRAGRSRPAAQLRRVADRPDPRGRHHRGRLDGELHRRRHRLRDPRHPRPSRSTSSTRCSASSGSATCIWQAADSRTRGFLARSHRRSHHAARRGPPAPGRPLARARQHRAAGARPTTRRSPSRSPRSCSRACSGCTATTAGSIRTSSTTSPSTTRTTRCRRCPSTCSRPT